MTNKRWTDKVVNVDVKEVMPTEVTPLPEWANTLVLDGDIPGSPLRTFLHRIKLALGIG